jgi:hypothetical protein
VIVTLAILSVTSALAADEPRRIDFTQSLMDGDAPIVDDVQCPNRSCSTPLTLGNAVYYSRRVPEQGLDFREAVRRDEVATRVREARDWPLLDADRAMIEKMLARLYPSPMFLGAAARILEPKN